MGMITPFDWQHSVGLDLAGGEELSSPFEPCLNPLIISILLTYRGLHDTVAQVFSSHP